MPAIAALPARCAMFVIAAMLSCLIAAPAAAQDFPKRNIRITTPYPTGISPDIAARLVADKLSRHWNRQTVIEPRPGANGFIAIGAVKKGAADGHELLLASNAHFSINPHLMKELPYDAENDFVPVGLIYRAPFFVAVATNGPYRTMQDLIAAARADANRIAYSTAYVGSPGHLGGALLAFLTGTQMLAVHFRDGAQLYTSIVNGDVAFGIATVGSFASLIKANRLRLIAIAARTRLASEPDVPTLTEQGGPEGFEVDSWVGLLAPRGTPVEVIRLLNDQIAAALNDADVRERFRGMGVEPAPVTTTAMSGLMRSDYRRYADLVKRIGITPE
jgi:tripartite-type tricarboxylate transporter receptor subunit TctC